MVGFQITADYTIDEKMLKNLPGARQYLCAFRQPYALNVTFKTLDTVFWHSTFLILKTKLYFPVDFL